MTWLHVINTRYSSFLQSCVTLDGQPPIDTGRVRWQVYTTVFNAFASNQLINLFEGPIHHVRPVCSSEARSSGLLKILGGIIAHSIICQEAHLSPTLYWYIVDGEEKALQFAYVENLPADEHCKLG